MGEVDSDYRDYWSLLGVFFVSVGLICLGGYRFYVVQRDAAQREVTNEFQSIADLKAEEIVAWRAERLDDARVVTSDRALVSGVHALVNGQASTATKREVVHRLEDFCSSYQYANVVLIGSNGNEIWHNGALYGAAGHFRAILGEVAARGTPILRDLHADDDGGFHLGLNVPLKMQGDGKLFAMLSFAIDPEKYLFPMLDRWPGPARAGETLLLRRDGNDALCLEGQNSGVKTRRVARQSLNNRDSVAVKAIRGESGLIRGRDRLGRQVVATVRPLADSPWLVCTQVPLEAIEKPLRDRALPVSLAVVSLILAAGMTTAYLWRLRERRYDAARQGAELEKQALFTHYNFLSRSLSDAILLLNERGEIVEANDRAAEMYGYSRQELLGANAETLQAKESRHGFLSYWKLAEEQPEALAEAVHARKDGETFPVEIGALRIDVEGVTYHQAIIRDITQRNRAKRQLENANRLYAVLSQCNQAILHAATEQQMFSAVCEAAMLEGGFPLAAVAHLDPESRQVSPAAAAGRAKEYFEGIPLSAGLDALGQGPIGTAFRSGATAVTDDIENDVRMSSWRERAMRYGLRSVVCVPIERRGLVEFAFVLYSREPAFFNAPEMRLVEEIAANVSYALGRLDEEAARKAAEKALLQSEMRYRRLVESAPLGLYVHQAGLIRYMNAAGLAMLGAESMEEVVGTEVLSHVHPEDRQLVSERIARLQAGEPAPLIEERFVRSDGSHLHVEVSAVPIQFDGEDGILVFFFDATQRKKAEEERARMEEQFLQAQKMESIGRLAGGVAHDFNNNLTVINGYCDLLFSSLPEDSPARSQISLIRKAGGQAAKLTRQLLTFSHRQVFSPKNVDLNELVSEAKSLFSRLIGGNIRVDARLHPDLPSVLADPTQINQVLMNLAVNARDAMPGGGSLIISTEVVDLLPRQAARIVGARPGHFVALSITDTGAGMDAETKRHIFEPFFTTKPRGSGTGLGLATVYGIIQQSNGWVEVDSTLGKGTTFRILLPAVAGGPALEIEASTKNTPGHGTVLLVEDQTDVRSLLSTFLDNLGYSVLEAGSGAEALDVSAQFHSRIDILVTDVMMPGMTGPELARRMRNLRPAIRVLLVSGYAESEGIGSRGKAREFELLSKPFTPSELAAKVRDVLKS